MNTSNGEKQYQVIGAMSGTSLDGLDLCYSKFSYQNNTWNYQILACQTLEYSEELTERLKNATQLSGEQLCLLDQELGIFFSHAINKFIEINKLQRNEIDAICSHGHTIFHQPKKQLSIQIGSGATIARHTSIPTIANFRQKDVLYGGQGAPLVPIGDLLLFYNQADSFLNIGGFANFSKIQNNTIKIASDICPVNNLINYYTRQLGLPYDKNGEIARKTNVSVELLEELNNINIYKSSQRLSMGWEWVEKEVVSLIEESKIAVAEKIATVTEHACIQISKQLNDHISKNIFVTGGGAFNTFLIEQLRRKVNGNIVIAPEQLIHFKEALIFGFLGVLFLEKIPNCIHSVTGAQKSVVGGVLFEP